MKQMKKLTKRDKIQLESYIMSYLKSVYKGSIKTDLANFTNFNKKDYTCQVVINCLLESISQLTDALMTHKCNHIELVSIGKDPNPPSLSSPYDMNIVLKVMQIKSLLRR
jgi:hypothetical protein